MKPIKIAFFGNTNNFPFLLAQGMRKLGHHVIIIINRKDILHRPEARYPHLINNYPDWVIDCSDLTDEDFAFQSKATKQVLEYLTDNVELAILNDLGPALAGSIGCPYVAFLTGSDLTYYANFDSLALRTQHWNPEFKRSQRGRQYLLAFAGLVARQRDGILGATTVCFAERGLISEGDNILDEIGVVDSRRFMPILSNTHDLQARPQPNNSCLTLLNGARIVFEKNSNCMMTSQDVKGTDLLLHGFEAFIRGGGVGILRLIRKGRNLSSLEGLIRNSSLKENIQWLDEMPLNYFYEAIAAADLVCDQFASSFPGMVTFDAFALGRPVIANFRNEILGRRFSMPLPGFQANHPLQIADHLSTISQKPELLIEFGRLSRDFADRFMTPEKIANELILRCFSSEPLI